MNRCPPTPPEMLASIAPGAALAREGEGQSPPAMLASIVLGAVVTRLRILPGVTHRLAQVAPRMTDYR